ncbi:MULTISPECIES: selenocysteine-specific translation elongation factor [Psychrilyobacter]|uniref:Selenocysteine-specific elongation factor n=1 Tax=Psychrilyobacter piezotolerans TaxID=2293438 RepID=A0ABX9KJF0_9FUSO|nr:MULTISPECIES: selenocysteine-specific translation elongation factor [Psychrilyobacter]MCS5421122.1 selenocysteine-specific translation elongation factor [Psychrilyobacter sp. S5]NDI77106.1 selenocysteine-specific translation elongation factor [Psychrilyobacter piezotolerans]RDE64106.1 selenocysteine-specific translation elongation factor [Psychrilyobacter sp. S5]REI42198.1 selenocysteine-specific translation elongation factor [Psychrilyobacter piezotolerans]
MSIVIGTAGHIDHGKTTLIKNLTGVDTDRLPEEKKRGISIDLGFSYLDLQGEKVGIIDVPGHEKFVKNMMAGATGIDIVMLVIAADDGIMPQTREHFDIVRLLGIHHGVVVITKCDKASKERVLEVRREIEEELGGSFLSGASMIETSIDNPDSYQEVRDSLSELVKTIKDEEQEKIVFRMSVDRSFSVKGFGTVITGTSQGKDLKVGDSLQIYPGDRVAKVRGIQNHGLSVDTLSAGNRCAINLAGIDKEDIKRGSVVATPNSLSVTRLMDVEINYLSSNSKVLKNNQRVRFHHGTKEIICRIKLLDQQELKAGDSGYAQLILEKELVGFTGDLGILRNYSPMFTIGGVTILNPMAAKAKRFDEKLIGKLKGGKSDNSVKLSSVIEELSSKYPSFEDIKLNFGSAEDITESLEKLVKNKEVLELTALNETVYMHKNFLEEKKAELLSMLEEFHSKNPLLIGENTSTVRNKVFSKKFKNKNYLEILSKLEDDKVIKVNSGLVSAFDFEIKLSKNQEKIKEIILKTYKDNGYKPPKYEELSKLTSDPKELKRVFDMMVLLGKLKFIEKDVFLLDSDYNNLMMVINQLGEGGKEIALPDVKGKIDTSRKYLVAYLEHLDKVGVTKRVDNARVLV